MKRRGVFLIVLALVLISLMSVVYAVSVNYMYLDAGGYSLNGVNAVVYDKVSKAKIGPTYINSGNAISIDYQNDISNYYTYHFKDNYIPYQKTLSGNGDAYLYRANTCGANSFIDLPAAGTTNQQITITATLNKKVTDIFGSFLVGGYPEFVPSELKDHYTIDTKLKLYVNDVSKVEKIFKITNDPNLNIVTFNWTPTTGNYNIAVSTEVIDTQCQSFEDVQDSLTKSITITQPAQQCLENWQCGYPYYNSGNNTWSTCANNIQSRVCSDLNNCGTTANKPAITQSCTISENCPDSSTTCPKDANTKCLSGHKACACETFNGNICQSGQTCAGKTYLYLGTNTGGTCCSIPCATSQTNQTSNQTAECAPGEEALCLPDSNGCAQKKTCTSSSGTLKWSNCYRINLNCMSTQDCVDTTASGTCSQAFPGTLCISGQLIESSLCPASSNTTTSASGSCLEIWNCTAWTECDSYDRHTCLKWEDINKCGTANNQPPNYQKCSFTQTPAYGQYQTYLQTQSFKGAESDSGRTIIFGQGGETPSVQNLFNALIPRGYSLKLGLDTSLALLIISIFIASVFFYYFAKYKHPIKQIKEKIKAPQAKEPLKPVKINDLMLNVIESLEGDEKKITQKLIEGEGIRISKLREILSINKTKMEIALSKLERRQIIKERTDDDSKLYFNDWLK